MQYISKNSIILAWLAYFRLYISKKGLIFIIPVEKNHKYTAEITAISSEGNGIAKIEGYTLFVPGTVTGDVCELLVLKTNKNFGYAKATNIITPSRYRVEPPCTHFSKCGGCQLMTIDYSFQLEFKKNIVKDALLRIGKIDIEPDIIGMEKPERYRNKMVFPFTQVGDWGFYRQRSHDVIPLNDCLLGDGLNTQIMNVISTHVKKYNIPPYDETAHKGIIRRAFLRTAQNEAMIVISVNADSIPKSDELIKKITALSPKISSIILNINKKRTNLVLGDKNVTLWGKDALSDNICGLSYEISPHSFFQVNPVQTEKLYKKAIQFAKIGKNDTVLDIYCGIGTISLTAAKSAKSVIGVEIVPKAIEDAKKNAERNSIKNAEFYCSAAEDIVPQLLNNNISPDIVILDPPRKGSDEKTLSAIALAKPKRIIYVSCNPSTLARDAQFLTKNGYTAKKATAVDMFPHTVHVETVMLLSRQIAD